MKQSLRPILFPAALALAIATALALRLPELARKPMHTDEAVQAAKAGALFERGYYRYDPREFHGPTLYYFTQPVLKFFSAADDFAHSSEQNYRIVPALFGAAILLWLWLLADGLGGFAAAAAGLLLALSPANVFYSRYYIQETLLVFFSLGAIACGWRWLKAESVTRRRAWALGTGLCLGLMHATKETCVLGWAALAVGVWVGRRRGAHLLLDASEKASGSGGASCALRHPPRWGGPPGVEILIALGAAVGVSILFYSSFFTNARGPLDSVLTYANYFSRASDAGGGHDKPFYYYARLLLWNSTPVGVWSEGLIVALAGVAIWRKRGKETGRRDACGTGGLRRFFMGYTAALIILYSAIAYKTPWCVLSLLSGLIVLAGIGAQRIVLGVWRASRVLGVGVVLALLTGLLNLGWQANAAAYKFSSDARNPYVYVHPTPDVVRLGERIEALARVHPDGEKMRVSVMAPGADYWPLPWYLRRLKNVEFRSEAPVQLDAPVLVAAPEFVPELSLELKDKYQINAYGLRPGVKVWLYVEEGLWKRFLEGLGHR